MISTLISRVINHHSPLFIIIKSFAHTQSQGSKGRGHILSFKELLHSFDMKLQIYSIKAKQYVCHGTVISLGRWKEQ
jgi:hypothetical protein